MRSLLKLALLAPMFCAGMLSAQDSAAGPVLTWQSALSANNHADVVLQLVRYHDFGQYDYEVHQVAAAAMDHLEKAVRDAKKDAKLAAGFDIDETALSNWFAMSDCGFCAYKIQARDYANVKAPAIVPVLELYKFAKGLGVKTFFITGRTESQRDFTIKNLNEVGYDGWEDLGMKPNGSTEPARTFKSGKRQAIVDKGYTIVLNIGDQASDLAGCCAQRSFKLPNPFYLMP